MFVDTLDFVSSISFSGGYHFDKIAVWRDPELGDFWWAADSGCSCPQQFERIDGFGDMNVLTDSTWREFNRAVMDRDPDSGVSGADRLAWLHKLASRIRNLRADPFVPVVPNPFQQEES